MSRCFHPENFTITWVHQAKTEFHFVGGKAAQPNTASQGSKPHLRFHCRDCSFTAYYAPHNAPHWFSGKLADAGVHFPGVEHFLLKQSA